MTPERWTQICELYHAACALPPGERAAFLHGASPDDESLRREVESLLAEMDSDDGFLERPALAPSGRAVSDLLPADMCGRSLGAYQLDALLGSGGMGEVYRARDTNLGRDVAIKILHGVFTSDPNRLARFEREARMLAALNHPNICSIYGVEESSGIRFLILEFVEGETLAAKLAHVPDDQTGRRGLPLGDALVVARQVAEALEVAHDKGIIHRDLKPANINITPDGVVKVLDFGLAKAVSGDSSAPDLTQIPDDAAAGRRQGGVMGTAAYMSPEQARGLAVDKRTDIWAFGCVLYEMLTGRVAFAGETASDSIAKVLEREPDWSALPASTPAAICRLLFRCLTKDPKKRLRDIGDVRIEIDALDEVIPGVAEAAHAAPAKVATTWLPWVALVALAAGVGTWEVSRPQPIWDPLAGATFSPITNWAGTEERAEISPDGNLVAFLSDKDGQIDVWRTQLGTGDFENLTLDVPPMVSHGGLLRSLGFNGNGSEIWFSPSGNPGQPKELMPWSGVTRRRFLNAGQSAPAWSPTSPRLVYQASSEPGDPLFLADHLGANPAEIPAVAAPAGTQGPFFRKGVHTHNPAWSPDGEWLYFAYGRDPAGEMDVWRMRPSGASPERLTYHNSELNFLAPIDSRTVLYVTRAEDWSGPWLWALDVETRVTRRVTNGLERYTSVSASRDGRRVIATVANPTTSLWRLPLRGRRVEESDVEAYPVPTERALAPRFARESLFYLSLSARGPGDGLFRVESGPAFEVRKGADGVVYEPPVPSPDGSRVAVVVRHQGKRHLEVMSADGTNSRTLAASIEIEGVAGRGTADWSPDGIWIVMGGRNAQGPGLFKIPVDGGPPVRISTREARSPVWSPNNDLIAYSVPPESGAGGQDTLRAMGLDGTEVPLPEIPVRLGGAHRFLRDGTGLVYLRGVEARDFWLFDFKTNRERQLTNLGDCGYVNGFDTTPDGKYLVFDRTLQNSNIVLIELPKK